MLRRLISRSSGHRTKSLTPRSLRFESRRSGFEALEDRRLLSIQPVSVNVSGVPGGGFSPSVSADGRYIAFSSGTSSLVAGDTNNTEDVFVRDTVSNTTTLVSSGASSEGNDFSRYPSISADGRYVAFYSKATNLVAGDTNGFMDVFVHDMSTGGTVLASTGASALANGDSSFPSISADGRYVAFRSDATNLVAGAESAVYVRDLVSNTTIVAATGAHGPSIGSTGRPRISADGRYVTFESTDSGLVAGDTNFTQDIFVRDLVGNTTVRASVGASGQGNSFSTSPSISADGRYVAFQSDANNLVAGDVNNFTDVFVRDLVANTITRVSVGVTGEVNNMSRNPSISGDGRFVAFSSRASNFGVADTNFREDIYVRDTVNNTTLRVSKGAGGEGNQDSLNPAISQDGLHVAFDSDASNLVANDTNGAGDVFAHFNSPPFNMHMNHQRVLENRPAGTVVGTIFTDDPDPEDSFVYTLVPGSGDSDNASFSINAGGDVVTNGPFDAETKSTYTIRVQTDDQQEGTYQTSFNIFIDNGPDAPTDVSLSANTVAENSLANTVVGTLGATDQDSSETFTYTLVAGTGSADNSKFNIAGDNLRTSQPLNFEAQSSYSIRVRVTDKDSLTFEKQFTITATDVNEPPSDITLTPSNVPENSAGGTVVGTLAVTDPEGGAQTLALIDNAGGRFTLSGTQIVVAANANLDFETTPFYLITVRATDSTNLSFDKQIRIDVTDVNEPSRFVIVTGADAGGGPHIQVFDAGTQALKAGFFAYAPNFAGGVRVASGDVTGDGIPDVITAAGPGGGPHVQVFDGVTFQPINGPLRSFFAYPAGFTGGVNVATADVNHDGFADIITGADAGGGPHVEVFSGQTGALLYSFMAYSTSFSGGVRVAAGDVNADGRADIITVSGPGAAPAAHVYDGATGALVSNFLVYGSQFSGGAYVAAGDVDANGRADVITGAGTGGGPHVRAFNALTGAELAGLMAFDPSFTGGVRVGAADVNHDGKAEVVVTTGPGIASSLKVFQTGPVVQVAAFAPYGGFTGGAFVAGNPLGLIGSIHAPVNGGSALSTLVVTSPASTPITSSAPAPAASVNQPASASSQPTDAGQQQAAVAAHEVIFSSGSVIDPDSLDDLDAAPSSVVDSLFAIAAW